MTIRNLRSAVAGIQQNRRIRAIALEVINGRATVKLAGSSQLLYGLSITGGTIVAGQEVYVDYTTGNPVVHSYQEDSPSVSLATRTKVREIIRDPEIPLSVSNHTHVESQITDLLHNAASIRGRTITTGSPSDGNTLLWDESSGSWIYGLCDEVEEAPIDGLLYGRKDGSWSEVTSGSGGGVTDHTELTNIGINTHDEIDTALLRLANTSGSNTGDQDLSDYLTDASSDGKTYGRKNGQWSEIVTGSGVATTLDDLLDVSAGSPVNGQTLIYSSGSEIWIPGTISGGDNIYPSFTAPPALDTWTWRNQGTATVSGAENKIYMKALALEGGSWRILERNCPTSPFTLTAAFLMTLVGYNYSQAGLALTESSSGKLVTYSLTGDYADPGFSINKQNSVTSWNSLYRKTLIRPTGTAIVYLRIKDDNTNRIMYFSFDGVNFIQIFSIGRTDFCTPDKIGFGITTTNATYDAALCLLSWKVE